MIYEILILNIFVKLFYAHSEQTLLFHPHMTAFLLSIATPCIADKTLRKKLH